MVERAVYRNNNPHIPVHQIVLDPFESEFRPKGRIKTQDRIAPSSTTISVAAEPIAKEPVIVKQTKPEFQFPVDLKSLSQDFEIDLIKQGLADSQYNQKKTAEKLSLTYHQLRGYLKKYNLLESTGEDIEE